MATGRKNEPRPLIRMTVRFYASDLDILRTAFPNAGYNRVIRELVSKFVRTIEAKAAEHLQEEESTDSLIEGVDDILENFGG